MSCKTAIALFKDSDIKGNVIFHQCKFGDPVTVMFDLYDLIPERTRAIHIHEYGDERQGCKSLGGHWNSAGTHHGSFQYPRRQRHAGDLINNFRSDADGRFKYMYEDPTLNLFGDVEETIIGRSVVVHDGIDDLGVGGLNLETGRVVDPKLYKESLKTGNARGRMGCAIIGLANPDVKITG